MPPEASTTVASAGAPTRPTAAIRSPTTSTSASYSPSALITRPPCNTVARSSLMRSCSSSSSCRRVAAQLGARVRKDVAQAPHELVDHGAVGDERRRDVQHRVAAVVGPRDEPRLQEAAGEEAAQQPLALRRVEPPVRGVADELDRPEEARAADVADDR